MDTQGTLTRVRPPDSCDHGLDERHRPQFRGLTLSKEGGVTTVVGAIIQARMGSTRLPGKVLREINGRPMLAYMLERVAAARRVHIVAVATTDLPEDDLIEELCDKQGVFVYRGSQEDVLDRYLQCARRLNLDVVVRVTSDCPLIDPCIIDELVAVYLAGSCDYVANTIPPVGTYPNGMDVEVISYAAIERAWTDAKDQSEREHVTSYVWQRPHMFRTYRYDLSENLSRYRLTVDYMEDLEVVKAILTNLHVRNPLFSMGDIVGFLQENPELANSNGWIPWSWPKECRP